MDLSPDDDHFQGRLLHQAALWDNVELLQELVEGGAGVDLADARGRTALHAAALQERSACLRALAAAGADLDRQSDEHTGGKSALHLAAERGHVENVRALLSAGARAGARDAQGMSALALAERGRHRAAARALRAAQDAEECERLSQHLALREMVSLGDAPALRSRLAALGRDAGLVANLTPGGANTLLYVASEAGLTQAVGALLEAGADGRAHPVTKYCPLYIATYHGHVDIARLLLAHFPHAVQQETVEKWLPLHAACIGGRAKLVTLLLEYPYPSSVLSTYTEATGQWQYSFAFDVNACDASGQTALYVACTLGNLPVVEALLAHTVPATRVARPESQEPAQSEAAVSPAASAPAPSGVLSPHRAGISLGIHAIVNKLTGATSKTEASEGEHRVRPVRVDVTRGGDSCVSCATRLGHVRVVRRLLAAGAPADAPAHPPDVDQVCGEARDRRRSRSAAPAPSGTASGSARAAASPSPSPGRGYGSHKEGPWTALAVAARLRHTQLAELLLQHGATDPHCRALAECARHGLHDLLAAILATKAYPDPDHKLNKSTVCESVLSARGREGGGDSALSFSALCPSVPVMVNWRELRCQLACIRMSWLVGASLRVNSKVRGGRGALHALTRIDVSNNELRLLPPELFTLLSLKYLNAAQNKLERLPTPSDAFDEDVDGRGRRERRAPAPARHPRPHAYSAPALQELYLQDNRLEQVPGALFSLPALSTLDVSNNKLRALPPQLWAAPALRDLNAALNHLKDLPSADGHQGAATPPPPPGSPPAPAPAAPAPQSTSSSRSPSIERSEAEPCGEGGGGGGSEPEEDEGAVPTVGDRAGNAVCGEARRAHAWRATAERPERPPGGGGGLGGGSPLSALNLSHNQFTCVPAPLACRAPALQRLNMAYNSLRSMSYVTSYPAGLRQLDLSHNEITCWPSLPQVENLCSLEGDPLSCHCPGGGARARPRSAGSVRAQLLSAACPARRHLRLEALRTLILSNNLLTRIQLTTDDDGRRDAPARPDRADSDDDWQSGASSLKGRLLFPLLSMLDVSCNLLRAVPPAIHELSNLAVLNISGNKDITELPPQMGLLSRLWNLSTAGCALGEPLRSMLASGRYKSMDIVGYLLSVLQEAKPYARCKLMLVGLQGIGKTSLLECLRQESSLHHRRKPTDHWARRMGSKASQRNMSTVGVDIGVWTYEKQRSGRGPATFRTWDFGGQHEYYATHQYFLSRRCLYLVVWRATGGRRALAGALLWLRSIQARAPGSPVIMVATHYDQVASSTAPESESPEALQRLIRSSIMGAPDADKLGLPRVLDSVEVSCSTRHNIRLLADIVYSVAFSFKPPGSKEPLLEQRIPATYLALEECVTALAADLKEPVLRHDDYKRLVTQYMQQRCQRTFRDAAELHQATMFLHENGVLLHYDDATLKELYFLRPQWLCDVLAHVVTVREINPFANNGIMKVEDLAHVFKASPALGGGGSGGGGGGGEEARSLAVALLTKFELALCWDARVLLVPPLLPEHEPAVPQLAVRSRSWAGSSRGTPRRAWPCALAPLADPPGGTDSPTLIQDGGGSAVVSARGGGHALRRLLLLSYVPCGFWPRLCTRVLADAALADAAPKLYRPPAEMELDEGVCSALELPWGWKLWRSGLKLVCGELTLAALRELPPRRDAVLAAAGDDDDCDQEELYRNLRLRVRQEEAWCELDVQASACLELALPAQVCVVRRGDGQPIAGYQSISLEPCPEVLARVVALLADHVDLLLEDWYPALGTRFVHTSEGRCLITRVVPCPACLRAPDPPDPPAHLQLVQALRGLEVGGEARRARGSQESRASDGDSGVGAESTASSRLGSVEGAAGGGVGVAGGGGGAWRVAHGWTVEECILSACTARALRCPRHPDVRLRDVAPDTLLLDVEEGSRARWEDISGGAVAGRGAFGTVLAAAWRRPGAPRGAEPLPVALKALQPVPPPTAHDVQAQQAYKAAVSRWEREPGAAACRAYCGLRQELGVLGRLRHAHVVPLLAVCAAPLALLLALAPQGALDVVLRGYRSMGARVGERVARALALQAARALEYLHAKRVVYRDLKSENVLVWAMPRPQEALSAERSAAPVPVHVKLGDYGISRLAPASGTKGFGGTEGFMAPEIMRYNGEEEYNEKVDCFSYGMLLYEVVTLRQPFEGHDAVKEAVLEGARPALSPREAQYPCCVLETLRRCWSEAPGARPSAGALVCVCAAPEFTELQDACAAASSAPTAPGASAPAFLAAAAVPVADITEEGVGGWEVWFGGEPERAHTLLASRAAFTLQHTLRIPPEGGAPVSVTALCRVGRRIWLGDSAGRLAVYSASTCSLEWSVRVSEAVGGAASPAQALLPLPRTSRVALALQCGRLFLVSARRPSAGGGGSVLSELGAACALRCLAAVTTPQGLEVWAGGDGLYAYAVGAEGVRGADALPAKNVALLAAHATEPLVIAYCEPGVVVQAWCAAERGQAAARLDCSKLAPCSESLQSIAIDERLSDDRCRVTALCVLGDEVYVGTAWGCVVVAEAGSLRPLTVCRPYERDVVALVPLEAHPAAEGGPMLASFGHGYRPLLQRFAPQQAPGGPGAALGGLYCLLWRAQRWLPD